MTTEGKEFDLIRRLFAPLTSNRPEALRLLDDAAILSPIRDTDIALTTDTLVAGVHFRVEDPPEAAAARCLRSNLSDLAAMGAEPDCYTLAIAVPKGCDESWLDAFAHQLASDQARFSIDLVGGDTVSTPGPMTLTITAMGNMPKGQGIKRSTAAVGDDIYITGTIGDAFLGLAVLQGNIEVLSEEDAAFLKDRFWYPTPRTRIGPPLRGVASAMADVSDGLLADLGHICKASECNAEIILNQIPLSEAARRATRGESDKVVPILGGGDDYELVFAAPPDAQNVLKELEEQSGTPITRIGCVTDQKISTVRLLDGNDCEISHSQSGGYEHAW